MENNDSTDGHVTLIQSYRLGCKIKLGKYANLKRRKVHMKMKHENFQNT